MCVCDFVTANVVGGRASVLINSTEVQHKPSKYLYKLVIFLSARCVCCGFVQKQKKVCFFSFLAAFLEIFPFLWFFFLYFSLLTFSLCCSFCVVFVFSLLSFLLDSYLVSFSLAIPLYVCQMPELCVSVNFSFFVWVCVSEWMFR